MQLYMLVNLGALSYNHDKHDPPNYTLHDIFHATTPQMYRQECRHDDAVFYFLARSVSNPTGWHRLYRSASVFNTSLIVPCLFWLITQSFTWHALIGCCCCTLLCSLQGQCEVLFFLLRFVFFCFCFFFFFVFCLLAVSVCCMQTSSQTGDSCVSEARLTLSAGSGVLLCFF